MNRLRQSFIATLQRGGRLRLDGRTKRKCQHLLTRETMCWTHIRNPVVPLTNNLAERELRSYVIWRKLSYAVQSHRGNLFRPMV
jgi:transposase